KSVIAAATEDRILRSQCSVGKLKGRAGVVIEAAHKAVVQGKSNPNLGENLLHRLKMFAARLVEKLADTRKLFDDGLILGHFTIENAQRIGHCTPLTIHAHFPDDGLERLA